MSSPLTGFAGLPGGHTSVLGKVHVAVSISSLQVQEDQPTAQNWQLPVSCQLGLHDIFQDGPLHDLQVALEVLRLQDLLQLTLDVDSFAKHLVHGTGSAGWDEKQKVTQASSRVQAADRWRV